jgi:hypothetical protein
MEKNIKCIIFLNNLILVSEVVEIMNEIGEPDCKLINPYKVIKNSNDEFTLEPWLDCTNQNEIMLRSADALTFVEPKGNILDKYIELNS